MPHKQIHSTPQSWKIQPWHMNCFISLNFPIWSVLQHIPQLRRRASYNKIQTLSNHFHIFCITVNVQKMPNLNILFYIDPSFYDKNMHAIKDRMSWQSFFSKSTDEERKRYEINKNIKLQASQNNWFGESLVFLCS